MRMGVLGACCGGSTVPFGVEGYDDDLDSSRVKDDMEVFGQGVWLGAFCDCDPADGWNGKLENDWGKN